MDAYARSRQATVVEGGEGGLVLGRAVSHPGGGGQPGDTGVMRWAGGRPIIVTFLPRADALADPELIRTKPNLIPEHVDPIMRIALVER